MKVTSQSQPKYVMLPLLRLLMLSMTQELELSISTLEAVDDLI